MPAIRPSDLPAATSANPAGAIIIDQGALVERVTPLQVADAAIPLASQGDAETGSDNVKRMSPLRVKQSIEALGVTATTLASTDDDKGASRVGFMQDSLDAVGSTLQTEARRWVWAEHFGLSEEGTAADNTAAILDAVEFLRGQSFELSTNGLGSGPFTAYNSGLLMIGPGEFDIEPDTLAFTQDLGLIIRGCGSRRTNNSIKGRTNLVIVSDGEFGIQTYANGARGLTLEDFDLSYEGTDFTGDLLDFYSTPGVTLNRMHIGTNGTSGDTREQTARSCIRSTYDEFLHLNDVVMDGCIDGWWSDDTREPSEGFSAFGGANSTFVNVVVYDCIGSAFRHDGNRTRTGHTHISGGGNPISVSCTRVFKFDNIKGLNIIGAGMAGSTDKFATTEWMRVVNCSGNINGCYFNDNSKAGTLGGALSVTGNYLYCTDGFTVIQGPIDIHSNNFAKGTAGITLTPAAQCAVRAGPNIFSNLVTYSYDVSSDDALLAVAVTYDAGSDGSTSKFRNTSSRVTFLNLDAKGMTSSGTTVNVALTDTGRAFYSTAASTQTVNIPAAAAANSNCEFTFVKSSGAGDMVITAPSAIILNGKGAAKTTITLAAAKLGARIKLKATSVNWLVVDEVGDVTYA